MFLVHVKANICIYSLPPWLVYTQEGTYYSGLLCSSLYPGALPSSTFHQLYSFPLCGYTIDFLFFYFLCFLNFFNFSKFSFEYMVHWLYFKNNFKNTMKDFFLIVELAFRLHDYLKQQFDISTLSLCSTRL